MFVCNNLDDVLGPFVSGELAPEKRAELLQQGPESGLGLTKTHFGLATLPEPQGVEDKERLVRGTLLALLPDGQLVEALENTFGVHAVACHFLQSEALYAMGSRRHSRDNEPATTYTLGLLE